MLNEIELKKYLDDLSEQFEVSDFIHSDPISLAKRFTKKQDIEIVAFLVATIAWGNRKGIIKSGERLLEIMNHQPHVYVQTYSERKHDFVHRTFNSEDLNCFFIALQRIYQQNNSMEEVFSQHPSIKGLKGRIIQFRNSFTAGEFLPRTEKHLANPEKGSSAKRICMFLRWMVRPSNKGVDFGLWKNIPLSELRVPLDVHTSTQGRKLGLIQRTQNDWKTVEELHSHLDLFDPKDPSKYDFALFGLGVSEK